MTEIPIVDAKPYTALGRRLFWFRCPHCATWHYHCAPGWQPAACRREDSPYRQTGYHVDAIAYAPLDKYGDRA